MPRCKTRRTNCKSAARDSFQKKNPDADAATLKKLDEVFDSTPLFSFEAISESLIPAYQKNLSAADVQAGIDFYSSEAGKRLLEKLPAIMREANESGGQLVQQKLAAYSEELRTQAGGLRGRGEKQRRSRNPATRPSAETTKTTDAKVQVARRLRAVA